MILDHIIKPESVLCNAQARSKKHSLEILSELLARNNPEIANEEIFARLVERERLGCTSLDAGVAFPHCRVNGVRNSCGALMRLSEAVDFDAPDGQPVDLVLGLMVPSEVEAIHYADIEMLSTFLRDDVLRSRLRAAKSSADLYAALTVGQFDPVVSATGD